MAKHRFTPPSGIDREEFRKLCCDLVRNTDEQAISDFIAFGSFVTHCEFEATGDLVVSVVPLSDVDAELL
jgi:hypothetical protein